MASTTPAKSFASLLRNSNFISLGDLRNAKIVGKIFQVTKNDLYVDLGLKFHAVIKRPQTDSRLYVRGALVNLKLLDYEVTDRFIGSVSETSILEADAILKGLEWTPLGSRQGKKPEKIEDKQE